MSVPKTRRAGLDAERLERLRRARGRTGGEEHAAHALGPLLQADDVEARHAELVAAADAARRVAAEGPLHVRELGQIRDRLAQRLRQHRRRLRPGEVELREVARSRRRSRLARR